MHFNFLSKAHVGSNYHRVIFFKKPPVTESQLRFYSKKSFLRRLTQSFCVICMQTELITHQLKN